MKPDLTVPESIQSAERLQGTAGTKQLQDNKTNITDSSKYI